MNNFQTLWNFHAAKNNHNDLSVTVINEENEIGKSEFNFEQRYLCFTCN